MTVIGTRKDNPDEIWGMVTWDSSDRYYKNAESPIRTRTSSRCESCSPRTRSGSTATWSTEQSRLALT